MRESTYLNLMRIMKMAILVTGGAGFIGSNLTKELLDEGEEIVCLDDFNDYYSPSFKRSNVKPFEGNKNYRLYSGDVRDKGIVDKIFQENRISTVIHLAARAGVRASLKDPVLYTDVNLGGTTQLLEKSVRGKVENFVFASTSSAYGDTKIIPFREDDDTGTPLSPYAASKKAAEIMCKFYSLNYSLPITCLRFFTVYGPNGRPDMAIYKFTEAIYKGREIEVYGDTGSSRDYTYVADTVSGVKAAVRKKSSFELINLGNNHPINLSEIISIIEKELGKTAKMKNIGKQEGDVFATCADISKAQRLLGYNPKVRIDEGIKLFVEWYLSARAVISQL